MRLKILVFASLCACHAAFAQPSEREQLPSSDPAAGIKPQADLDTVKLAAAHREQAKSTDERTNGLWQSWLVSICKGCGDLPPARQHVEEQARRDAATSLRTTERQRPPEEAKPVAGREGDRGEARIPESDLSDQAVDRIRATPAR